MTNIINKYIDKYTNKVISTLDKTVESFDITGEGKNLSSVTTISQFRNKLESKKGVAKTNQFMVSFSLPSWLQEASFLSHFGITRFNEELGILCNKVTPPTKTIKNQSIKYGNMIERKIPMGYNWEEVTFSFIERNDYFIYNLFNEWIDGINNPITNTGKFYNDIIADTKINFLNKNDNILAYCTLYESYPSSISISSYNWEQLNQYVSIDVTFNYIYSTNRDYNLTQLTSVFTEFGKSDVATTLGDITNINLKGLATKLSFGLL